MASGASEYRGYPEPKAVGGAYLRNLGLGFEGLGLGFRIQA